MKHGRKNAELKNLTFIIYNITEYKISEIEKPLVILNIWKGFW